MRAAAALLGGGGRRAAWAGRALALALWRIGPRLALDGSALNRPRIGLAGLRLFAANPDGVGLGNSGALALARALFAAVASGAPCALWGEDGTRRVLPRARIDPEYANPLYADEVAELWRRDAP